MSVRPLKNRRYKAEIDRLRGSLWICFHWFYKRTVILATERPAEDGERTLTRHNPPADPAHREA